MPIRGPDPKPIDRLQAEGLPTDVESIEENGGGPDVQLRKQDIGRERRTASLHPNPPWYVDGYRWVRFEKLTFNELAWPTSATKRTYPPERNLAPT